MLIALATCANLPGHEHDDTPLHAALVSRGASVEHPVWSHGAVDWSRYDACLIRSTWDYQEHRSAFVDWAHRVERTTRLFNRATVVEWNTHKSYLADLAAKGIRTLPTVWLRQGAAESIADHVRSRGWHRAFLKPAIGATARETLRFRVSEAELVHAQTHADRLLAVEDALLQPYCETVETEGELSAIFVDGAFSHGVRKVPVAGDYRVQDDFGAHDEPCDLPPAVRTLAERAVASVDGDLLYARCDFLLDASDQPCVTELELVEPSMFFRHRPAAAEQLADALLGRLDAN